MALDDDDMFGATPGDDIRLVAHTFLDMASADELAQDPSVDDVTINNAFLLAASRLSEIASVQDKVTANAMLKGMGLLVVDLMSRVEATENISRTELIIQLRGGVDSPL